MDDCGCSSDHIVDTAIVVIIVVVVTKQIKVIILAVLAMVAIPSSVLVWYWQQYQNSAQWPPDQPLENTVQHTGGNTTYCKHMDNNNNNNNNNNT